MNDLVKRKWVFIRSTLEYEMSDCCCGSADVTWSEYEGFLWCFNCKKDYEPEHRGIFDGPIPIGTADLIVSLDIFDLENEEIVTCNTPKWRKLILGDENA